MREAARLDFLADQQRSLAGEHHGLADRGVERVRERDRDDEGQAHVRGHLLVRWQRDRRRRTKIAVIEPDELPVFARGRGRARCG